MRVEWAILKGNFLIVHGARVRNTFRNCPKDEAISILLRKNFLSAFGSPGGDPTYEAARERIRRQGVEQWLPLFYEKLETLFDYLGADALIALDVRPGGVCVVSALAARERCSNDV